MRCSYFLILEGLHAFAVHTTAHIAALAAIPGNIARYTAHLKTISTLLTFDPSVLLIESVA